MEKILIRMMITLAISCLQLFVVNGQNLEKGLWEKAQQNYENEDFQKAIEHYQELIEMGIVDVSLYHNLGLSYFKNAELGLAVLNLEKALKRKPNSKLIRNNLDLIKENIDTDLFEVEEFFLKRWFRLVSFIAPLPVWLFLFIGFLGFALYLLYNYLINSDTFGLRVPVYYGAITSFIFFAIFSLSFFFGNLNYKNAQNGAVVMVEKASLRAGAENNSEINMEVSEGVKVWILDEIGDFYKVRLADLTEGWIVKEALERI